MTRTLMWCGGHLRHLIDALIISSSTLGDREIFNPRDFSWAQRLESQWPVILEEAEAILRHRDSVPPLAEISIDHERIGAAGLWRSFFIWGYGIKVEKNAARCPRTTEIVEQIPGLKTALFSILEPGAHIDRHVGVTKAILICHLGLKIPSNRKDCHMYLNGQDLTWEPGKIFVFDDTYPHEVWNNTHEERVVLLLQFKRPLRQPGRFFADLFLRAITMTPFVQDTRKALGAWEDRFKQSEEAAQD